MPNSLIIGSQWGDEGKAKIIDYLTKNSDVIVRFQGGANAGHTVIAQGTKFIFHMVPSGIMYPDKVGVIGNSVVFDAQQFIREVDDLRAKGISVENRLFISDLAHLVFPYHKKLDITRESSLKKNKIGTTGRGIGPTYADKVSRVGLRTGDLIHWDDFTGKVEAIFAEKKFLLEKVYNVPCDLELDAIIAEYRELREKISPLITDTSRYLFQCVQDKRNVLFEGAQGTFLDIDHGTYPFVTSSNTIAGAASVGTGTSPRILDHIIGIVKAYTTRVGNGPFPTELTDNDGELLQKQGYEFGATTGRPRRCGWLDSVMLRKAMQLNGFTRIAITKLDVLNTFETIKICTHYELDGKTIDYFPSAITDLERVKPVYETYDGWQIDINACTSFADLPERAVKYLNRISQLCYDVPILLVSVGPERDQTMIVNPLN